jgi:glycosidase
MKRHHFISGTSKLVIYQLLLRVFSNTNGSNKSYGTLAENGSGKFNDIDETVLNSLRDFGVSHIWYTGIIEHSSLSAYPEFGIQSDDPHIVKGRAGSPYAIRDYYDVDADLAVNVDERLKEFETMIQRTHDCKLKAIIDFVPNHVARSYHSDMNPGEKNDFGKGDNTQQLFNSQNDFLYLQDETFQSPSDYIPLGGGTLPKGFTKFVESPARVTGNDVYSSHPSSNDWFETIKINFGVDPNPPHKCFFDPIPSSWIKLLDILLYWCKKGVDGFRCDMAEMVPAEFWEWIIPCVKTKYPKVVFIAEIYKPELYENYLDKGYFDFLYDKVDLYDTLGGVIRGYNSADDISQCIRNVERYSERMLSFMENHDEERLASRFFASNPFAGVPAMVISACISKGPVMIYFGQEVGEPAKDIVGFAGDRGRTSIFDYCTAPELQKWFNQGKCDGAKLSADQKNLRATYSLLFNFISKSQAIHHGDLYDLQYVNRHHQSEGFDEKYHFAFLRHSKEEKLLIVVNFNKETEYQMYIRIPLDALNCMGMDIKKKFNFTSVLGSEVIGSLTAGELFTEGDRFSGLKLKLLPNSAYIICIH